jgi:hypothetical protein
MKKTLYLFPLLLSILSGCFGSKNDNPTPATPTGTFAGPFTYLHRHANTGKTDTLSANIILTLSTSTGFKVTGDTSTLHAGSYGPCVFNSGYNSAVFSDKTAPASGTPTKFHLNGSYGYAYDGTNLKIVAQGTVDSLSFIYILKKTGN